MIEQGKKRLLDTNICANYLNALRKSENKRSPEQQRIFENIEKIKKHTKLYISQATVAELRFGAEKSQSRDKNLARIKKFKAAILELKIDDEVWKVFVKIKAELSRIGRPIADMDLLIAATAKRYNLMLTSNDKDMDNLDFLTDNCVERESWL
jgi:tRNA(fMet)-specific endonuclease VapC